MDLRRGKNAALCLCAKEYAPFWLWSDLHNDLLLWQKKICLGFDWSKDHSKTKYLLRYVFVLPKQQIVLQVRLWQVGNCVSFAQC